MFQNNWFAEDNMIDDIDPGKDIFALLFLSFFLINAVVLFCISDDQQKNNVPVNTTEKKKGKRIDQSFLATMLIQKNKICIYQKNKQYCLPEDIDNMIAKANFQKREVESGNSVNVLTIIDPGQSISAGSLLKAIEMLNKAKISVEFCSVKSNYEGAK